jgi:hypothetical protein
VDTNPRIAIAVTHCIRCQWGPSLEDVIRKATNEGYTIHVLKRYPLNRLPAHCEPPTLFGPRERASDFKVTQDDYHAYQSTLSVLMMQPRFMAAIFMGGILSRICYQHIRPEELLSGPSSDASRYGFRWRSDRGYCYIEDRITDEEMELLVGMFHIATSKLPLQP